MCPIYGHTVVTSIPSAGPVAPAGEIHGSLMGASPLLRRSTSDRRSEVLRRGSGGARGRVWCRIGAIGSQTSGCLGRQAGFGRVAGTRETGQRREPGHRLGWLMLQESAVPTPSSSRAPISGLGLAWPLARPTGPTGPASTAVCSFFTNCGPKNATFAVRKPTRLRNQPARRSRRFRPSFGLRVSGLPDLLSRHPLGHASSPVRCQAGSLFCVGALSCWRLVQKALP
jgi:hypothetical protein